MLKVGDELCCSCCCCRLLLNCQGTSSKSIITHPTPPQSHHQKLTTTTLDSVGLLTLEPSSHRFVRVILARVPCTHARTLRTCLTLAHFSDLCLLHKHSSSAYTSNVICAVFCLEHVSTNSLRLKITLIALFMQSNTIAHVRYPRDL